MLLNVRSSKKETNKQTNRQINKKIEKKTDVFPHGVLSSVPEAIYIPR